MNTTWVSLDAEQCVLGAMLQSESAISAAMKVLSEESFHDPRHRLIFRAMQGLALRRRPIDLITVDAECEKLARNSADLSANAKYLVELTQRVPTTANVGGYIGIVLEKYGRRRLYSLSEAMRDMASDDGTELPEIIDTIRDSLRKVAQGTPDWMTMSQVLMQTYDALDRRMLGLDKPVSTGLPSLDDVFYGFVPGEFTVIGARPGVGKSAFAGSVAVNAAMSGKKVAIVSLEMSDIQFGQRLFAYMSSIDSKKIRKAALEDEELQQIVAAMTGLSGLPIVFMFAGRKIEQISAAIQQRADREGVDLLIVDYLQLLETTGREKSNYERVTYLSRALKELSILLNIPVIALAQLSRASALRSDKRPILSDFRDSGAIEQDADNVIFLHRPETADDHGVDKRDSEYFEQYIQGGLQYLYLSVEKQRQGEIADMNVLFDPKVMRFTPVGRR